MRAYAMSLPEDQRDPEFARILSTTAILPQSAGGMSEKEFSSFATGNAEKFMSFGFYKSELNNLTKATFLKKALNSEEAAKTSPTALMAQIQISEDMKAIYQGMKHGSKGVVSIGVDKEEQVDLSKEGAGDLALQRLRDERENLQAQYNYRDRDETSQGRGIASTVRPPVLNYWNNAWM